MKKKLYRFIYCLAAVGQCFCAEQNVENVLIPQGYDSIFIQPDENTNYCNEFVILDSSRIFAKYIVFFEFDPNGDEKLLVRLLFI